MHVRGESNWWYEYVCFGIATSSCVILYSITRRASVLRSARLRQFRCLKHVTDARGVMIAVSNIPSSPILYLF